MKAPSGCFWADFELLPPAFDRVIDAGKRPQGCGHIRQVTQLEAHIAGVTGRGRPNVSVPQCVHDGAIATGTFAEHATPPVAAAAEALLDRRQHFVQQEVFPCTDRSRVDVLVAAEPGEAIGEGNDDRRQAPLSDQPIEPLRQVLAKADPVGMGQATAGKASQVDEQRQASPIVPGRDIHIDVTRRRVTEHVGLEHRALDDNAADGSRRPDKLTHMCCPPRTPDRRASDASSCACRPVRQQRQQCRGGGAEVAIAAMDRDDRDGRPHRRHVERHQQAAAQFVAHTAFRHERQAEAGLRQAFLCGQAVDQGDIGGVQSGMDQFLARTWPEESRSPRDGGKPIQRSPCNRRESRTRRPASRWPGSATTSIDSLPASCATSSARSVLK